MTQFTENVTTVQVLCLFAGGAVIGAALSGMVVAVRANRKEKGIQSQGYSL